MLADMFGSLAPSEANEVRLAEGGKLEVRLKFGPETDALLARGRERLMSILSDAGAQPKVADWRVEKPGTSVHYGGTVRMHHSPEHGVLNEWNRPFEVPNLVVADASCFTTNSEKNPTLTAMALSCRAADRLAADLKAGE